MGGRRLEVAQERALIGGKRSKKKGKIQNRSTYSRRYSKITTKSKPNARAMQKSKRCRMNERGRRAEFQGQALGREGENEEKNRGRIVIVMVKQRI